MPEQRAGRAAAGPVEGGLEVEARVVEALPGALFRLELEGEDRGEVTAHLAGSSSLLRVRPGDRVVVGLSAYDPGRGRILRRRS